MAKINITANLGKALIVFLLLIFAPSVFAAAAKPASLMLQEGLYAEEIEGNLDAAIKIYQQVITNSQQMEQAAAQATYRIGLCYLKKSDNEHAAEQFRQVIAKYTKQESLVKEAQNQLDKLASSQMKSVPVVVSTKPENYSNNISANTTQLSVTFNREMKDKSWSWVKWNYPYPETTGQPSYDNTKTIFSLSVKLEPGKAYLIRINAGQYSSFMSADGVKAQPFVFVFATLDANGKPTPIPQEMLDFAKQINSAVPEKPFTQEFNADITPDGVLKFKGTTIQKNSGSSTMTSLSFVNSDFVNVTAMQDDKGRPLKFTTSHNGNIFRYNVTLNEPVKPGEIFTYSTEGTMTGMVKPVAGKEDMFSIQMIHSPAAGQATLRIETYLLPKDSELISTNPTDMKHKEKDGRIELRNEKIIPVGGNIITEFQYKLSGANINLSQQPEQIIKEAVMTISTCAESDSRVAASLNTLQGLDQKTAVKEIVGYLDNEAANVRRSAIYILWKGDFASIEPAQEKLLKLCTHEENLTRGMAALAIGEKKVSAGFEVLKNMTLNDKDGYARRCAAYALGLYGNTEALPTLKKAIEDEDPLVKNNAQAAIALLSKQN
jgi:hypothetical protein